jgi:predicted DNA-binding protein (MmcQ/YjbR family)
MTLDRLLEHSLSKPNVEETFPFGPDVLVLKVKGKVFLLIPLNSYPVQFNAKCDPERAILLREEHASIIPGYLMNKKHWNTIILDGTIPSSLIIKLVDHSYDLVSDSASKKEKRR